MLFIRLPNQLTAASQIQPIVPGTYNIKSYVIENLNVTYFNTLTGNYEMTRRLHPFVGRQLRVISYCVYLPLLCSYD